MSPRFCARARFVVVVACAFASCALSSSCIHQQQVHDLVQWTSAKQIKTPTAIIVHDVRVFPATSTAALEHQDVIVEGDKITAVRASGSALPTGAFVIDGAGKTLLPGLVDAHLHTQVTGAAPWYVVLPNPEHVLQEALYAGVTTAHDMGGPVDAVLDLKQRVARGEIIGPRLLVAGPMLSAPGGYPGAYIRRVLPLLAPIFLPGYTREVATPADGVKVVDDIVGRGVDYVKVALADTPDGTPVIDAATLDAITAEAHKLGKRVFAHIDTAKNARLAADHGVDGLVHAVHSTAMS
ncbi:MAG TPA: amidohydrolase family protein, partial [Myxococcota bacterium]